MAFVHLVDTDRNEHYIRYESIVDVRTTMSGGAFVDVAGLESPIFVKQSAREMVEMILNSDVLDRPLGGG